MDGFKNSPREFFRLPFQHLNISLSIWWPLLLMTCSLMANLEQPAVDLCSLSLFSSFLADSPICKLCHRLTCAPHQPCVWYRYINDTFVVIKTEYINKFTNHINNIDPNIKFTSGGGGRITSNFLFLIRWCVASMMVPSKRKCTGNLHTLSNTIISPHITHLSTNWVWSELSCLAQSLSSPIQLTKRLKLLK